MSGRYCSLLVVTVLLLASTAGAVELLQLGQSAPRQGILLDVQTSFRVLQALEDYPQLKKENAELRTLVAKQEALEEIRKEREKLYQERITFLEMQSLKWQQLNEATLALAKQNREAQGTWWDRLAHDAGKMTLGGIFGAAIAMALIL